MPAEVNVIRPDMTVQVEDETHYASSAKRASAATDDVEHHRDHDGEVEVDSDNDEGAPEDTSPDAPLKFNFSWRKLWRFAGPGWLMSLAYLVAFQSERALISLNMAAGLVVVVFS